MTILLVGVDRTWDNRAVFLTEAVFQKQIKRETNKFKANFDRNDLLSIDDLGSLKHLP
jgi:hypothetical protein